MSLVMAKKGKIKSRSGYQVYTSPLPSTLTGTVNNVIDMTERKLIALATKHTDENIRKLAARLLQDYVSGKIAVAWEDGIVPVYCFINHSK